MQDAKEGEDDQELPQEDAIRDPAQEAHDGISEEHPEQRLVGWPERSGGDQDSSDNRIHDRLSLGLPEAGYRERLWASERCAGQHEDQSTEQPACAARRRHGLRELASRAVILLAL